MEYVSTPPPPSHRIYCTLIPTVAFSPSQQRSRSSCQYTLYVEHLGTLIPVLEATRRSSKLRPSFTISLPSSASHLETLPPSTRTHLEATPQDTLMDLTDHPSGTHLRGLGADDREAHNSLNTESGIQLACKEDDGDNPRHTNSTAVLEGERAVPPSSTSRHLVEVSSHIIASKYRIQTIHPRLPMDMGTVSIKTSFLHIQPRKVVVNIPIPESDSGIDSDSNLEDCSSDEELFVESDMSLDSLSSMEELEACSANVPTRQMAEAHSYHRPHSRAQRSSGTSNVSSMDAQVVIHSKTPTWNEQHMIYQLDFGGRVTTKSAKNFQLEIGSEQVSTRSMVTPTLCRPSRTNHAPYFVVVWS